MCRNILYIHYKMKHILNADKHITNCNYFLDKNLFGNTSINIAFNTSQIFKYSNDWLYLIWSYYHPNHGLYKNIMSTWEHIKNKAPDIHLPGTSVLVSSSFSSGTVHGYVGIWEIISDIKKSNIQYDNYLVHQNAQQGIKDIIHCAFPDCNIQYITPNVIYNIESLQLPEIIHHNYHYVSELEYIVTNIQPLITSVFLHRYIHEQPEKIDKLAVIKTTSGQNLTGDGVYNYDTTIQFCASRGFVYIDPKDMHESKYCNLLYHSKNILFSWGTTHFKGLLYISDECENIIIIVKDSFKQQYDGLHKANQLVSKYKNATIRYIQVETDSDLHSIQLF